MGSIDFEIMGPSQNNEKLLSLLQDLEQATKDEAEANQQLEDTNKNVQQLQFHNQDIDDEINQNIKALALV